MDKDGLIGSFYSWDILSENLAIKHIVKSFVEHSGTSIPKEITWFFCCDRLNDGDRKPINLIFKNEKYDGHLEKGADGHSRTIMFWRGPLMDKFQDVYSNVGVYPISCFERISTNVYLVQFINECSLENADKYRNRPYLRMLELLRND